MNASEPSTSNLAAPPAWMPVGIVLAAGILLATVAAGLDPAKRVTQYLHQAWRDELPHSTVQDVLQTDDGYLWLATQEGLVRFDGLRFTVFTPRDTPALGDAHVLTLFSDSRGRLWIGTRGGGLTTFADGDFAAVDSPGKVIFAITEDRSGQIWVGTLRGLLCFDGVLWTHFGRREGLPNDTVRALLEDSRGTLWVGTRESGLSRFQDGRFVSWTESFERPLAEDLLDVDVVRLLEDGDGGLWIGTRNRGLLRWHQGRLSTLTTADGLTADTIFDLLLDRDGNLWIATYGGGLNRFDGHGLAALTAADRLTSDIVLSLHEDREGSLWVGTSGGGLNRLRDGAVTAWTAREGLGSDNAYCVLEDRGGVLWIGTEGGGLNRLENGRFTTLTTADGLSSDSVTALLEDRSGTLWVGTRDAGLNRLQDGEVTVYTREDGLSSDSVFALAEDAAGTLWAGTVRGGLSVLENGRWSSYDAGPELASASIFALASDSRGRLLIGTDGLGLKILDGGEMSAVTTADGLSSDIVVSLLADSDGTVWAGTYRGLNRIRERGVVAIGSGDGLFDDRIFQILDDGAGSLWMSSNRGIFSVRKRRLEAFEPGLAVVTAAAYGTDHGMPSSECAAGTQPAGWRGDDGRLWFPTVAGVASLDPADLRTNPVPPPVRIESVLIDGRAYSPQSSPRLAPGKERFEIRYAGLSLLVPEKVRFRYRLEGFDRSWVDAGDARSTTFTNLPTGRSYRFVVTAANNDGVWNVDGASFSFYVEPHFYETPAFLAFSAVLLLLLGTGAYRLRMRHLLRRTQELERKVAERTAEVVAEKERVETANRELEKLNQVKSEFLAIAAHDLKNPLTVIYGHAGQIAKGGQTEPRVRGGARSISASVNQMLNIISDLLDTTALETGQLSLNRELQDLALLVAEALEHNSVRAAERGIQLRFEVEVEDSYYAVVDPERILRVFDNLISNAIKFSNDGLAVDVGLERTVDVDRPVIRFKVRDQGPGLSAEDQRKLFRRFQRLSARPVTKDSSSGLGLSIVKQFVDLHGGAVRVDSRLGEGASFVVELPAAE